MACTATIDTYQRHTGNTQQRSAISFLSSQSTLDQSFVRIQHPVSTHDQLERSLILN